MSKSSKDPLAKALHDASVEVATQHPDDHAKMMAATAIPSWLMTILQLVGPAILSAVQKWIASQTPPAPAPANPTPATTKPIGA